MGEMAGWRKMWHELPIIMKKNTNSVVTVFSHRIKQRGRLRRGQGRLAGFLLSASLSGKSRITNSSDGSKKC